MKCINPACGKELEVNWIACPFCQTPIAHRTYQECRQCHRELEAGWQSCPYCATAICKEISLDSFVDGDISTMTEWNIEMVYVEPGKFLMGSDTEEAAAVPIHEVTISKGFWIGRYLITQDKYSMIMNKTPSEFKGGELPVEMVSWYDAEKFCKKLTNLDDQDGFLPKGYIYRLPTEAEWEFVAHGGNQSCGYRYSGSDDIDQVAWYKINSELQTHAVGQRLPNELGIFDMSGNVCEWCHDWYSDYYSHSQTDPAGKSSGYMRVGRGGNWFYFADYCRVSDRLHIAPSDLNSGVGFRIVLAPVISNIITNELLSLNNLGRE
jgi:formylglycine-generating enzyme required for sulfatase activity